MSREGRTNRLLAGDAIPLSKDLRASLAEWIRACKGLRGWSLSELARQSKVSRVTVSGFANEQRDAKADTLVKLSNTAKLPLPYDLAELVGRPGYEGEDSELRIRAVIEMLEDALCKARGLLDGTIPSTAQVVGMKGAAVVDAAAKAAKNKKKKRKGP